MSSHRDNLNELRLLLTVEHPCNYLAGRTACNLVADPKAVDKDLYSQLARHGFRRSGNYVYRPHCAHCQACLSLRIPVLNFRPNRAQQRVWHKNQDLWVRSLTPHFRADHYFLFERYLKARHPNGGMDDCSPHSYLSFITSTWSDTLLYELRIEKRLLAVAVVDRLDDGLSAVYTFFDPAEAVRSLGIYAILWQIAEAKRQGLPWVYLGYWIEGCQKMAYKANFKPYQVFLAGQWLYGTPSGGHSDPNPPAQVKD